MPVSPILIPIVLGHALFSGEPTLVGLFLGTAIHDTAQVAGASLVYLAQLGTPELLEIATVTKLQRNMFMLAVIPLIAFAPRHECPRTPLSSQLRKAVPLFVFGFLGMSLLRTVGDFGDRPFGLLRQETWDAAIAASTQIAALRLSLAMAAVGLGTSFARLRGLGIHPSASGSRQRPSSAS